jgi:hypothetical protein
LFVVCLIAFSLTSSVARAGTGWINVCPFDHRSMDDPIVYPRKPGATHLHDFFGNKSTDAFSTYHSLLRHRTGCDMNGDRAAYWAPALKSGGRYRRPSSVRIYYRANTVPLDDIRPYPRGLEIVAGDAHATRRQSTRYVSWGCGEKEYDHPIDCGNSDLVAHVKFPSCWDGERKDSRNHKRHMAYPKDDATCPRSHPIPVPRLILRIAWRVSDSRHIRLSSGPYYTLHGDFYNAWRPHTLARLVHRCIDAGVDCGEPGRS